MVLCWSTEFGIHRSAHWRFAMSNQLAPALTWLAEAAGLRIDTDHGWTHAYTSRDNLGRYVGVTDIPGASGTLSLEDVGLVESWLAKAGYMVSISNWRGIVLVEIGHQLASETADTLPEALASAVVALYEASK